MLTNRNIREAGPGAVAASRLESPPPSISIEIEELVLHGFRPGDSYHISEAIQRELSRLLSERKAPVSLPWEDEAGRLDAGSIRLATDAKPQTIGNHVAGAIYDGLT